VRENVTLAPLVEGAAFQTTQPWGQKHGELAVTVDVSMHSQQRPTAGNDPVVKLRDDFVGQVRCDLRGLQLHIAIDTHAAPLAHECGGDPGKATRVFDGSLGDRQVDFHQSTRRRSA